MGIVEAVKARNTEQVKSLLAEDPSLAHTETPDGSLVLTAIYYGARDAAELIAAAKGRLDVFEASALGDVAALTAALGADPASANAFNHEGMTPLGLASFMHQAEAVALLLDRGAAIDAFSRSTKPGVPRNTALHAATASRAQAVVRLLLERGANPNLLDSNNDTPLCSAAWGGDVETIRLLLAHGADRRMGPPAAEIARSRGHAEAAALLEG